MKTSAILEAAKKGQIENVRAALSTGADIEETNEHGATALLLACANGHTEVVCLLLESGADVHHANNNDSTPFTYTCYIGNTEILRLLLEPKHKVNINHTTNGTVKGTGLILAACHKNTQIIRLLLESKKENLLLNKQDRAGKTALMYACEHGLTDSVHLLLKAGAAVNMEDSDGNTALLYACKHGNTDIARLLLDAGANADHANKHGATPFTVTCYIGNTEILRMLLEPRHNIDINHTISAMAKRTGLILAAKYRKTEIIQLLFTLRKEDLLINKKDSYYGKTALVYACKNNMTESIHLLLGHLIEKINDETLTKKHSEGQHTLTTKQTIEDIITKIFNGNQGAAETDNLVDLLNFALRGLSSSISRKKTRLFLTQTIEKHLKAIMNLDNPNTLQSGKEKTDLLYSNIRIIKMTKRDTREKTAAVKMRGFIRAIEEKQASLKSTDSLVNAVNYLAKSQNYSNNNTALYLLNTELTPESKASLLETLKTLYPTKFKQLKRRLKDVIPAVETGKLMLQEQTLLKTLFEAHEAFKQTTQQPAAADDPCNDNAFLFILRTGTSHYEQKDTNSFTAMKNKIMGTPLTDALGKMGAFARRFTQASTSPENKPFTDVSFTL